MGRIKDNFDDKGFVVVKSLVSTKMIFKIFQQVEQLIDEALKIKKVNPSEFENVDTKYMFLKKNYPKIKSHIYDLIKYLDGVHAISTMPSLLEIIEELSGPSLLLDGIQLGINDFDNDNLIPFHQEMYNSFSYQCIAAWIPLIDLSVEKGTLAFVPKSHKNGYVKHTQINGYPAIVENIDSSKVEYAYLNKGDALFFHRHLFHGSSANHSSRIRWTFISRYCPISEIPYLEDDMATLRIPYDFD